MRLYLIASLILVAVCLSLLIPQASALPVSYNQTALNFGLTSVPRNSSSYDVFPLIPDNWLWEKFDNNTVDSSPLSIIGTVNYNTNLKRMWHFENVLADSTTNNKILTKASGTTTYVGGHEGNGLSFDGSTYYTASGTGIINGTGDRSVSFWIDTPTSFTATDMLFSYGNGVNSIFGSFWTSSGSSSTLVLWGGSNDVISNTVFQTNQWYHIVITLGSSGTVRTLYVNGILDKQSTTTALNTSGSTFYLGTRPDGPGSDDLHGIIDEFRYYSNTLSQAQVSALYMVGHYSQSHTFDGGEYVTTNLDFSNQPFSFSFWFNFPDNTAGTFNDNKGVLGNDIYGIRTAPVAEHTNYLEMFLKLNDGSVEPRVNGAFTPGQYNYATFTWDKTTLKMYINNILVSSSTRNLPTASSSTNINIGGANNNGACCVIGQIDNVKVYPYALSSSQITSDYNSISPIASGKQFMSWYNGVSGSSTLTEKLGTTKSSLSLSCNLGTWLANVPSNNTNLYYMCMGVNTVHQLDINSGTDTTYFHALQPLNLMGSQANGIVLFPTLKNIIAFIADPSGASPTSSTKTLNVTLSGPTANSWSPISNQKVGMSGYEIKYNYNNTIITNSGVTTNPCEINYTPTNTTKIVDAIQCDKSIPAKTIRYWNGMAITGAGNYATNSTQQFLSSIDANQYKKLLSLPCNLLVSDAPPCTTFILTDLTQTDYFVVLTSSHVYYQKAQTALNYLTKNNYALQSYDVTTQATTSAFEIPNPILQSMTLYGFNINTTVTKTGLFTLPSGYSVRTTTVSPSVRLIDPRWSNDVTDMPVITSTSSLFPIFLTVSNTPAFSAIKVTSGQQLLNNQEAVWAVAQLDSTRSVEVDLPPGVCANVYIADISISPSIWNFQGIICATGVNQKTLAYTNTLPLSFFTLKYGVSDSYVPSNNGLVTTFHTQNAPTTYNVLVKNSTGTVAINQTFTVPANQTIDTQSFNVSSVSKPAVLVVNVGGNQIYSSYLGSPLSLANVASFFHQYFNYQGFDLLSFIPIIFSAMFTRSTVGIGSALVVVLMATLSFLSVVTIPDTAIYMSIFISCIAMVGYRGYQAYG